MLDHITHPQGRNSLTLNKFTWRFLALSATDSSVIHIIATTEREAREQSPTACVMVFAGRLPLQRVMEMITPSQGIEEITTPSTVEKTSMVQEVRHV